MSIKRKTVLTIHTMISFVPPLSFCLVERGDPMPTGMISIRRTLLPCTSPPLPSLPLPKPKPFSSLLRVSLLFFCLKPSFALFFFFFLIPTFTSFSFFYCLHPPNLLQDDDSMVGQQEARIQVPKSPGHHLSLGDNNADPVAYTPHHRPTPQSGSKLVVGPFIARHQGRSVGV